MQERTFLPEPVPSAISRVMEVGSSLHSFSTESVTQAPRIRDAKLFYSVCPYCAVGCSQNVYVRYSIP